MPLVSTVAQVVAPEALLPIMVAHLFAQVAGPASPVAVLPLVQGQLRFPVVVVVLEVLVHQETQPLNQVAAVVWVLQLASLAQA